MKKELIKKVFICRYCLSPNIKEMVYIPSNNFDIKYGEYINHPDRFYCNNCDESDENCNVLSVFDTKKLQYLDSFELLNFLDSISRLSEHQKEMIKQHYLSLTDFQMIGYFDIDDEDFDDTIYVYEDGKDELIKIE